MFSNISFWQYLVFFAVAFYLFFFRRTVTQRYKRNRAGFFVPSEGGLYLHISTAMKKHVEWYKNGGIITALFITLPFWTLLLLIEFFLAPFIWSAKRRAKRQAEERAQEMRREARERRRREFEEENERRERARRAWFEENPPRLFTNTMFGITVVMTPADYEANVVETRRALRNETWEHEGVLVPSDKAAVFVNNTGMKHFGPGKPHPEGWLTDFDDLAGKWNAELVPMPGIFVPYVSETLAPFSEHKSLRGNASALEPFLIVSQAPENLRPVFPTREQLEG